MKRGRDVAKGGRPGGIVPQKLISRNAVKQLEEWLSVPYGRLSLRLRIGTEPSFPTSASPLRKGESNLEILSPRVSRRDGWFIPRRSSNRGIVEWFRMAWCDFPGCYRRGETARQILHAANRHRIEQPRVRYTSWGLQHRKCLR